MSTEAFSQLDYLSALLRSRLVLSNVQTQRFDAPWTTPDDVITTHRFILVLQGGMRYEVEGDATSVRTNQMIFVPAWVRRIWSADPEDGCELLWCEFSADEVDVGIRTPYLRPECDVEIETASLSRMLKLWPGIRLAMEVGGRQIPDAILSPERKLELEGELKAALGRFWPAARPCGQEWGWGPSINPGMHPEIKRALLCLHEFSLEPDALKRLFKDIALSPNHFRHIFRETIGCSPQEYVTRVRLRRARYLVHNTQLPLKQIAACVGYADPLFFSRHYHHFWGHSPRKDRSQEQAKQSPTIR